MTFDGGMETAFHEALAVASGDSEVEIVREGALEVGTLSTCEMLGVVATIGGGRARAVRLIATRATSSPTMVKSTSAAEDYPPIESQADGDGLAVIEWVWALVRGDKTRGDGIWVRYPANEAPEGLAVRPAQPPAPGSLGVVVLHVPEASGAELAEVTEAAAAARPTRRRGAPAPHDRNLVTVAEFAIALDVAESTVFDWLTRGLPSVKTKGLGRRILRQQAEAWLVNGGPERSRAAKKLAKTADLADRANANGAGRG